MKPCCADCGVPLRYVAAVVSGVGSLNGWVCDPCQTVTERFGTLDVTSPVAVRAA